MSFPEIQSNNIGCRWQKLRQFKVVTKVLWWFSRALTFKWIKLIVPLLVNENLNFVQLEIDQISLWCIIPKSFIRRFIFKRPEVRDSLFFSASIFSKPVFPKSDFKKVNFWSCISIFERHSILRCSSEDITVTPVFLKHIVSYLEIQAPEPLKISNGEISIWVNTGCDFTMLCSFVTITIR